MKIPARGSAFPGGDCFLERRRWPPGNARGRASRLPPFSARPGHGEGAQGEKMQAAKEAVLRAAGMAKGRRAKKRRPQKRPFSARPGMAKGRRARKRRPQKRPFSAQPGHGEGARGRASLPARFQAACFSPGRFVFSWAPPHNSAVRRALSFPSSAACRFLDSPPVYLRNLHLQLTKNPFAGQPPHLCGVALEKAGFSAARMV